jgi:hypothetical protein
MITTKTEREHLSELQTRDARGLPLTDDERAQLDAFYRRLDEEEAAVLAPAMERHRKERAEIAAKTRELEAIRDQLLVSYDQLKSLIGEIQALQQRADELVASVPPMIEAEHIAA